RNVDDPAEQGDALVQPHHRDRVGHLAATPAGGDADHGVRHDGPGAAERHRLPVALAAALTEFLRGDGERTATPAPDSAEPAGARSFEEPLQVDHPLSHGRTGSPERSRYSRREYG